MNAWKEPADSSSHEWQPVKTKPLEVYRKEVVGYLLHRMPRPRLQQIMETEFTKADTGGIGQGKGYLSHGELVNCLKNWSGFGVELEEHEIVQMLNDADVDKNGKIFYNE
jgi:hypothetical protein